MVYVGSTGLYRHLPRYAYYVYIKNYNLFFVKLLIPMKNIPYN